MAQEMPGNEKDRERIFDLLPDGSQLKNVMRPRYDENRNLVGVLKSKIIRFVNSEEYAAEAVSIEFFNKDKGQSGRIDLAKAIFRKKLGMLVATEVVDIKSDKLTARGTALHYSFQDGEGFLSGPVTTIIQTPTETTMNSPSPSLRATAVLGLSLLAQSLPAAPVITAEEKAAVRADAASRAAAAGAAAATTRTLLDKDIADSAKAKQAVTRFLVQADLPAPAAEEEFAPAVPLEFTPGPDSTKLTSDGGLYFESKERVLVYLKNVKVTNPEFDLECQELKLFFAEKKEEDKKAKPDPESKDGQPAEPKKEKSAKDLFGSGMGVDFGEPERIVATGAVLFTQKKAAKGQQPIKASGAIFSYNLTDDQIVISGGYPWVFQPPSNALRAKEANLSLRISPKAGTFVVDKGQWETLFNSEQLNKKDK
ncbi:MAG: hypothetical protein EOP88_03660 [Verrucomicrobiaceae bacterium]|nr:MAG: hypothetical protein EOP88_03660 [Verrucomicrobiaceae bacterium]